MRSFQREEDERVVSYIVSPPEPPTDWSADLDTLADALRRELRAEVRPGSTSEASLDFIVPSSNTIGWVDVDGTSIHIASDLPVAARSAILLRDAAGGVPPEGLWLYDEGFNAHVVISAEHSATDLEAAYDRAESEGDD